MAEKTIATVAFLLLLIGLSVRRNRRIHPICMVSGISMDFALVLLLQLDRGVIQDAISQEYSILQRGHIISSSVAFALYFPVVTLGVRRVLDLGSVRERMWHIRIGLSALLFRTLGFVLMFFI